MDNYLTNDAWTIVKSYLFYGKFQAIEIIKYHVELPYSLGLHNHKRDADIFQYLWDNHEQVFCVLCIKQVREIITTHNALTKRL